jgi:hypothetical protein
MQRQSHSDSLVRIGAAFALFALAFFALFSQNAQAWGTNGQKLVLNKAIDTLPLDIRPFFDANRTFLLQHLSDPADDLEKNPSEHHNYYIYLDKYGRFPFDSLPRSYKAAVSRFGKSKLQANGLLPWQIGVYSQKLTESLKAGRWEDAKLNASLLAYYVAEAHDPFNVTDNFDGHLSAQSGVNERFSILLIDRFSSFFPMRPNDATFINDPTDHAFDSCLSTHTWLEAVLLADRNAHRGETSYNDEYYDRFYNHAGAILIRQLSEAATDVGSFWLTAWTNAGRPVLPH